jgi:4-amino-4-deoxy-L-arabinose transferase-like glycosyltransferase
MDSKLNRNGSQDDWLSVKQRKWLWSLLALVCLLRVFMMFCLPFTDTTEARYAEIARKMVETRDWITPQFDYGVPFWGKPPLHTWMSALGMELFGVNQFGARFFIFVSGLGTLWMLYLWVRENRGRDYALTGVFIMSTTALIYISLATVMTDMVMATGVCMSMAGFYSAVKQRKNAKIWSYLFFVGLAIGMLAKGPVAVVLTGLPIGIWVLLENRWVETWKRLPWIKGSLLCCLIFMPWYLAAEIKTPGFLHYFIIGEHLNRFLLPGWKGDLYGNGHVEAKGMIWVFWFAAVLPWSFFFLFPLCHSKRIAQSIKAESNGWSLYLVCWAVAPMLFFTMASNIIATYVITGVPAVSFLAIDMWRYAFKFEGTPGRGVVRFFTATASLAVVLFIVATGIFLLVGPGVPKKTQKYLVEKVDSLRDENGGKLYYWKKRYYSAEFYTNGQVEVLDTNTQLDELLFNKKRDFLAIRSNYGSDLPVDFLDKFQFIGKFGKDVLYYEFPNKKAYAVSTPK